MLRAARKTGMVWTFASKLKRSGCDTVSADTVSKSAEKIPACTEYGIATESTSIPSSNVSRAKVYVFWRAFDAERRLPKLWCGCVISVSYGLAAVPPLRKLTERKRANLEGAPYLYLLGTVTMVTQ